MINDGIVQLANQLPFKQKQQDMDVSYSHITLNPAHLATAATRGHP
jgi:hypothetical protein